MNLDWNYYFEEINDNEIFSKVTIGVTKALDIFSVSDNLIKEIEKSGKQDINTTKIEDGVTIKGPVYIGEGTEIEKGCIIHGPVYIGKNCKLIYNSYIRPGTILGDDCVVGFCSEVKNTIMRDGSKVSDLAFVGDSIIGKNSRIGSGVIVANRGFNQSKISIKDENKELIDLEREFLGVILGDNSRVGSNATVSPGSFIGKYTWIYPHTCVHGFIPELKKVYDKQNLVFVDNPKKTLYKSTNYIYK